MKIVQSPAERETLRLALGYRARGWSVVPVTPRSKVPAVTWTPYQTRLASVAELEGWFSVGGYGVGLVQGAIAGTLVVDFDGEEGMATRARWEREHGPLPHTVEALTPGGGCHVVLRHPGHHVPTKKGVAPGVDVRGDGGFIVACPSVHENTRRYEWDVDHHPDEVEVAECPGWLLEILCAGAGAAPEPAAWNGWAGMNVPGAGNVHTLGSLGLREAPLADGREAYMRDTVMAVLADLCRSWGRAPTEEELFAEVWPQYSERVDFTRPGRGPDEVRVKCRYALARLARGLLPGLAAPEAGAESVGKPGVLLPGTEGAGDGYEARKDILHLTEVELLPPTRFLLEGLLPARGLSVLYGPPKSGKTFIALAMGLHIAAGLRWAGLGVQQAGVVYIAGEGLGGFPSRIKAARARFDISADIPFWVVSHAIDLTKPGAADWLVRLIREKVGPKQDIGLVVIDTLARSMPGADENSAQDVGRVVGVADRVGFLLSCAALALHHEGKVAGNGMRGSSALRGAVDATLRVAEQRVTKGAASRVTLKNEDQKDAETAADLVFEMEVVAVPGTIGKTSLVPVFVAGAVAPKQAVKGQSSTALDALLHVLSGPLGAMLPPGEGLPPGFRGCHLEAWRTEYYARRGELTTEAKRQAFHRAINTLSDMKLISRRDPWVWLTSREMDGDA